MSLHSIGMSVPLFLPPSIDNPSALEAFALFGGKVVVGQQLDCVLDQIVRVDEILKEETLIFHKTYS